MYFTLNTSPKQFVLAFPIHSTLSSSPIHSFPSSLAHSGGGLFDGVVARLRGVAGAVGATGDVGSVPLLHSLCQAQCTDFPQYEIIEQAPKGGDGEKVEEETEGDAKEARTERGREGVYERARKD